MKTKIAVLLSTYKGEKFLEKLLDSLIKQTLEFDLFIRDDGSNDSTQFIINNFNFTKKCTLEYFETGENIGVKASFEKLFLLAKNKYDYYCFCDQDDIWLENKIESAINSIQLLSEFNNNSIPILYHSDLIIIDSFGIKTGYTFWQTMNLNPLKNHKFGKRLCQPTITGCSVVFNQSLANCIDSIPKNAIMHDWWFGLVAFLLGKVISDNNSYILYRNHDTNVIGISKFTISKILHSLFNLISYSKVWKLRISQSRKQAKALLDFFTHKLNAEEKYTLNQFIISENKTFIVRKWIQIRNGFYYEGFIRNFFVFIFF